MKCCRDHQGSTVPVARRGWGRFVQPISLHGVAMRYVEDHRRQTHRRIVENASYGLRQKGAKGLSVVDLMKLAGLTHGGFYNHFESRAALVSEAIAFAAVTLLLGLCWLATLTTLLTAERRSWPVRDRSGHRRALQRPLAPRPIETSAVAWCYLSQSAKGDCTPRPRRAQPLPPPRVPCRIRSRTSRPEHSPFRR